jgi:hypothetical protein
MSDSVADLEAGDEEAGPVTIYDIQAAEDRKSGSERSLD